MKTDKLRKLLLQYQSNSTIYIIGDEEESTWYDFEIVRWTKWDGKLEKNGSLILLKKTKVVMN